MHYGAFRKFVNPTYPTMDTEDSVVCSSFYTKIYRMCANFDVIQF